MVTRNQSTGTEALKKQCYTDDGLVALEIADCSQCSGRTRSALSAALSTCDAACDATHFVAFISLLGTIWLLRETCRAPRLRRCHRSFTRILVHPHEVNLRVRAEDQGRLENSVTAKKSDRSNIDNIDNIRPMA